MVASIKFGTERWHELQAGLGPGAHVQYHEFKFPPLGDSVAELREWTRARRADFKAHE